MSPLKIESEVPADVTLVRVAVTSSTPMTSESIPLKDLLENMQKSVRDGATIYNPTMQFWQKADDESMVAVFHYWVAQGDLSISLPEVY